MKSRYIYGSLAPFLNVADLRIPFDRSAVFGNTRPLEVEVGFGTGEYLVRLAASAPGRNFIGFEQCATRIVKTLRKVKEAGCSNIRVLRLDAVWGFRLVLPPLSIDKVHCLFPCPWPKKRHAKHRLFQPDVLRLINSRLVPAGRLVIVTDHRPYRDWILEGAEGTGFVVSPKVVRPQYETKFERKWREAGQKEFYELEFIKQEEADVPSQGGCPVRAYFIKDFSPEDLKLRGVTGAITVKFGDFLYDPALRKGMAHAVVTEDRRLQHLWVMVAHTAKGWCVSAAAGTVVLPTEGAQKAIELVRDAAENSAG